MSLDGVFQLIWYQFVFRLRFDPCSFVFVYIQLQTKFLAQLYLLCFDFNCLVSSNFM